VLVLVVLVGDVGGICVCGVCGVGGCGVGGFA
jgi:hypothetical protein